MLTPNQVRELLKEHLNMYYGACKDIRNDLLSPHDVEDIKLVEIAAHTSIYTLIEVLELPEQAIDDLLESIQALYDQEVPDEHAHYTHAVNWIKRGCTPKNEYKPKKG